MRHFVDIDELEREDLEAIFERAEEIKTDPARYADALENRTLLMMFEKPSTRTRISFEAGMTQLGGHGIYFHSERSHLKRGETLADTAKVLSRYCDVLMARLYEHEQIVELEENAEIPVINGLTDSLHPCQVVSDLFTLREKGLDLERSRLVYLGDGNNVANSLLQACALAGMDCFVASPEKYGPDADIVERARKRAEKTGAEIKVLSDPEKAVEGADVLYTDVWISMGDSHSEEKKEALCPYKVNQRLVELAGPEVRVMHCLPAHRGEEITSEVMDGPHSIIFDQAENRLHVQKAVLDLLVNG